MKKNALEVMIIVAAVLALIGFGLSCVFSKRPEIVRQTATTRTAASTSTEETIAETSKKASKKKASQTSVATETTIIDTVSPTEDDYFPFPDDGPIYTIEPSGFGQEPIFTTEPSDFDGPIYTIEPPDFGEEKDPYDYDIGEICFDTEPSIAEI